MMGKNPHFLLIFARTYYLVSGGTGTRNLGFDKICSITMEKWVGGKFNNAFLHFLPNFAIFDGVSNVERTKGAAEL